MNDIQKRSLSPLKDINLKNMAAGFVAGIFIITGPSALILEASSNGSFTVAQTVGWIFSVYVFGGLLGIILPLYFRIPIVGGHSLTGVAFLAAITAQFTFTELIGAYIVSGILMFLIGALGLFEKLMSLVPKEIISAMLAGMITKYMVNFVISITQLLFIGGIALAAFFIFSKWKTRIPPVIAAIVTGFIALILTYPLNSSEWMSEAILPQMTVPDFNIASFLSVSIPLALLILSNDAAVAAGALEQNRYRAPVNRIISISGLFSILTSFFGGQSANIAGMGTAICSDDEAGPKEKRYMGAVAAGTSPADFRFVFVETRSDYSSITEGVYRNYCWLLTHWCVWKLPAAKLFQTDDEIKCSFYVYYCLFQYHPLFYKCSCLGLAHRGIDYESDRK